MTNWSSTNVPGVTKGKTAGGEQRYRWKRHVDGRVLRGYGFTRKADAVEEMERRVRDERLGLGGGRAPTFEDFAERDWLPTQRAGVAQGRLRSSTVYGRERDLRRHLLPALGGRRVDRIGVEAVTRLQNELTAAGQSNYSVRRIVGTLGTLLEYARRCRLVQFNPVRDVDLPPPRRRREPPLLTVEQVEHLAAHAPDVDVRNLILVAAYCGMRAGETFGLHWRSVELTAGQEALVVAQQFYAGELVERVKTPAGYREILLAPRAAEALRSQQVEGRSSADGLVFPAPLGGYWSSSNFNRRAWQPARAAAGLRDLHLHDLRHFYVTRIRAAGLPTSVTEQLAGHADERVHRLYTHQLESGKQVVREALARAFEGATQS